MKVKIKNKIVIEEDIVEAVQRFNIAFNQIKDVLVERDTEIDALKLAIITGSNIILDGPPGTSKTKLANEVFKRISGDEVVFFRKQLMKGTQPDELFGPMISKKYREQAIWEHNIDGMLPTAHFAFLDEVYRGSDMLLPSILGILNEHTFMNGLTEVKCPLVTAIATTNFVTDSPELEAFHDRWLIKMKVQPLKSSVTRIKMLTRFLEDTESIKVKQVSFEDIEKIRYAMREVNVESECIELYEEILEAYRSKVGGRYISDRRICQALRLAQAGLLVNKASERDVDPGHLLTTIYGIVTMGSDETQQFTESATNVLESYTQYQKENETVREFEDFASESMSEWDKGRISKEKAKTLYTNVKKIASGLSNAAPEDKPVKQQNQERITAVSDQLSELLNDLSAFLNK